MELKPIRTKSEYKAALRVIETLMDAALGSPKADKLEVLAMLVEQYEAKHYPIPAPDPIEFLNYAMEARGLTRKDLESYIGSRGRVAEVLNRVRPLTLAMIRSLSDGLNLPADVLILDYELREAA